jgi:putative Mg2+ transporter-C (MgtC) family protein
MQTVEFAVNMGVALALGLLIGLERQLRQHTAGLRTNGLVCLGAALFVSLSLYEVNNSDRTRVAGQVVTGIGFLGGGVIFKEGLTVKGLATAATLWCSGAVGVLAGSGFRVEAAIGAAAVLFTNMVLRPLVYYLDQRTKMTLEVETNYRMSVVCPGDQAALVRSIFMQHVNSEPSMTLHGIQSEDAGTAEKKTVIVNIVSCRRNDKYMNDLVSRLSSEPRVSAVSWQRVN